MCSELTLGNLSCSKLEDRNTIRIQLGSNQPNLTEWRLTLLALVNPLDNLTLEAISASLHDEESYLVAQA